MRNTANVVLGSSAKSSVHNKEKLQKQAEAVATGIMIPAGIEFAQFDHAGKKFA
jgi:hypothetical protein